MQLLTDNLNNNNNLVKKLIHAAVTPRPIAWVSSVNADGNANLAPYSFFNAVCSNPPTLMYSVGYREDAKDSLANVQQTGEFVVNFVTESNAYAMNLTAEGVPPEVDEFKLAGLTPIPSTVVAPPRVAESPVHFECQLNQIVTISEQPGGASIVIGTVVCIHVDDHIYDPDGDYIDFDAYQVVGRMTGNSYTRTRDRFDLVRPPRQTNKSD